MREISKNIEKLKQKFEDSAYADDQRMIRDWEKAAKKAMIMDDLSDNDAIKIIKHGIRKEIEEMNKVLMNDREQTQEERKMLFHRLDLYKWFLNLFDTATTTLKSVDKIVKDNL